MLRRLLNELAELRLFPMLSSLELSPLFSLWRVRWPCPWKLPVLQFTEALLSVGEKLPLESALGKVPGLWSSGIKKTVSSAKLPLFLKFCSITSLNVDWLKGSKPSRYMPTLLLYALRLRVRVTGLGVLTALLVSDWLLLLLVWVELETLLFRTMGRLMWLPLRAEISTQLSCFSLSSSMPSCRMGPLIIRPSFEGALFLPWWELLIFRLSILLSRLLVLDLVFFSFAFVLKLKLFNSLGKGRLLNESSFAMKLLDEQMLTTEFVLVLEASLCRVGWWLLVLLVLRIEATSCRSLRSVSMLSRLAAFGRRGASGEEEVLTSGFGGNTSNSSSLDHLLLSLWKVHLPLIAHGSSSSESSLCNEEQPWKCCLQTYKQPIAFKYNAH